MNNKARNLFVLLTGFFIANALMAEFIGTKIFSLEATLGLRPVNWTLFGIPNLSFNLTAGVLIWPVVFIMTDIINEYYGRRGVQFISWVAAGFIAYAFLMVRFAIGVEGADFWKTADVAGEAFNRDLAFDMIFSQGTWIIVGSLVAFIIGQLVDISVFSWVRKKTGEKHVWLRATGSTVVSQLIDSFVVLYIAFYLSGTFDLATVLAIAVMNYTYKLAIALAATPLIYASHALIDWFLGPELSKSLKNKAHGRSEVVVTPA